MFRAYDNVFQHIAIANAYQIGIASLLIDIPRFTVVTSMGHALMDRRVNDDGHHVVFFKLLQRLCNWAEAPLAGFSSKYLSGFASKSLRSFRHLHHQCEGRLASAFR